MSCVRWVTSDFLTKKCFRKPEVYPRLSQTSKMESLMYHITKVTIYYDKSLYVYLRLIFYT